jgi:hypothetical protein
MYLRNELCVLKKLNLFNALREQSLPERIRTLIYIYIYIYIYMTACEFVWVCVCVYVCVCVAASSVSCVSLLFTR